MTLDTACGEERKNRSQVTLKDFEMHLLLIHSFSNNRCLSFADRIKCISNCLVFLSLDRIKNWATILSSSFRGRRLSNISFCRPPSSFLSLHRYTWQVWKEKEFQLTSCEASFPFFWFSFTCISCPGSSTSFGETTGAFLWKPVMTTQETQTGKRRRELGREEWLL